MLRFTPIANAKHALSYYAKSDGGYYLEAGGLHCEWGGKGASLLGLSGPPDYEHFRRLIQGFDPHTGESLTAKLIEERIPGWDVTASMPKGVTSALERGDERIRRALWEAGREAMADLETMATTRVRKGGRQEDRLTGNLIWYAKEDAETRPTKEDQMPDWDRHIHFVVMNLTRDEAEGEWKAVKFRPIMDLRKWFSHRFDLRLAHKLAGIGYEIETTVRSDGRGGKRYHSWDIKGIPQSVIAKNSRRTGEVKQAERDTLQEIREREGEAPDQLSPVARDKLGATSRQHKRDDLTLEDYRAYWNAKITPQEGRQIAETIARAKKGVNPKPANTAEKGAAWAVAHQFERASVVGEKELEITAMERCLGAALPGEIGPALRREGVLTKDGQVTTRAIVEQEGRILAFARQGKGSMRPLREGMLAAAETPGLSTEQRTLVRHVMGSCDQVILVVGDAGTGKTTAIKPVFKAIDRPVEMLAPSADASRGVLRSEGFDRADTVASFLGSEQRQAGVRNGVIWVDEASLLGINDLERLCGIARQQNARLVMQGDPKQHRSVARDGNMMRVLEEHGGLAVGRLTEIWRQKDPKYKQAVAAIARGDILAGHGVLTDMGAIRSTPAVDHNKPLAEDYVAAVKAGQSVVVVAPTHREAEEVTARLRLRLKEEQMLGAEDHTLQTLKPLHWTEAQKADPLHYDGTELVQFHRNCGKFKAGQRIEAKELLPQLSRVKPGQFSVYAPMSAEFAEGDLIRITANSWDKSRKHRLDNGATACIRSIAKDGAVTLENGWVLDTPHLTHGYVSTSFASQGKTTDLALAAMGRESLPAVNAAQFYVTASRARHGFRLYTDVSPDELRAAIQKQDKRLSATELMSRRSCRHQSRGRHKLRGFLQRVQGYWQRLRDRVEEATSEFARERGLNHAEYAR